MNRWGMKGPKFIKVFGWTVMFYAFRYGTLPTEPEARRDLAMRVELLREKNGWSKNRIDRIKALLRLVRVPIVEADKWVKSTFDRDGVGEIL